MAAKKKSFEDNLKRLEEIVDLMENGNVGLEESLKLYKEGVDISVLCAQKLQDVQQQVSTLQKTASGLFEKQPFDPVEE